MPDDTGIGPALTKAGVMAVTSFPYNIQDLIKAKRQDELLRFRDDIGRRIEDKLADLRNYMVTGTALFTRAEDIEMIDDQMIEVRHLQYMLVEVQNGVLDHAGIRLPDDDIHAMVHEAEDVYKTVCSFRRR